MIKIYIKGLKDGLHDVSIVEPIENVPDMFPEYIGNIEINGKLRIIGRRIAFEGTAECDTKLICDISLKEFIHKVSADLKISFLVDGNFRNSLSHNDKFEELERIVADDDKYIDITDIVREELVVNLPMKRISPEYEGKEFDEIYPEYSVKNKILKTNDDLNDIWAPLKKLKLN